MDELDLQLSDVVLFELPSFEDSQAFRVHFRPRWPGWSADDEGVWLFTVDLSDARADLPQLLRDAQDLMIERGLPSIRFVLDDRIYTLEPAAAAAA